MCCCECKCKQEKKVFAVGDVIHGFCGGHFGRDSYSCKKVEHIGPDYIVFRILNDWGAGGVTIYSGTQEEIYSSLSEYMEKPDSEYYETCDC